MNAQISTAPQMNSVGLLNLEAFELSQRVAKMLSSSTLVPEQYRAVLKVKAGKDQNGQWVYRDEENPNGLSNCIIALNMANRMGADPLMIMQNLYLIEGRPSWSSQFIMASINSCGRFSALRFEIQDLGEKEVEYQETSWSGGKKQNLTKKIKIQNLTCVAWVIERESGERLESSKISIEMAVKEGWYQKNGSKWQTMPEQMLRYRAASFFGRVYAPELLMGLRSAEEEQDRIIDVTPEQGLSTKADISQLKRKILAAKSPAELDALEDQVFDIAEDEPRKELMKLVNAQAQKFQPKVVEDVPAAEEKPITKRQPKAVEEAPVENTQNQTSNAAADGELSVDELKRLQQEAEALVEQKKQPASGELRRAYAKALNTAKSLADVLDIEEQIENDAALNQGDAKYLTDNIEEVRAKFEQKAAQPAVDPTKSNAFKNGMLRSIEDSRDLERLEVLAPQITEAKLKLTNEHHQELLHAYAARKAILEDQNDMFNNN